MSYCVNIAEVFNVAMLPILYGCVDRITSWASMQDVVTKGLKINIANIIVQGEATSYENNYLC